MATKTQLTHKRSTVDITHIRVGVKIPNPRRHLGDVTELSNDIESNGLRYGLVVWKHREMDEETGKEVVVYDLMGGFRRHASILEVLERNDKFPKKVKTIEYEGDYKAVRPLVLGDNLHRTNLTPLEEAEELERLRKEGFKQKELAQQLSKSPAWVSRRLQLVRKTTEEVRDALADEKISMSAAQKLAHKVPKKEQGAVLEKAIEAEEAGGSSLETVEEIVNPTPESVPVPAEPEPAPEPTPKATPETVEPKPSPAPKARKGPPTVKDMGEALKQIPDDLPTSAMQQAFNGFEAAIVYAMGQCTLPEALQMAGLPILETESSESTPEPEPTPEPVVEASEPKPSYLYEIGQSVTANGDTGKVSSRMAHDGAIMYDIETESGGVCTFAEKDISGAPKKTKVKKIDLADIPL